MKNSTFLSVLIEALKRSILIVVATGLFSMVPVDIVYYLLNVKHPFNSRVDALPLEWLCAVSLVIAIAYLVPIMVGGATLASGLWHYRARRPKQLGGALLGGICGTVFFAIGTECFLILTQESDLQNWIFRTVMIGWGSAIFAWLGHRIEALYAARSLPQSMPLKQ